MMAALSISSDPRDARDAWNDPPKTARHVVLPSRGTLLVSAGLHGDRDDFRALRRLFVDALARDDEAHWVILGDAACTLDDAGGESRAIEESLAMLRELYPGRVHTLLGDRALRRLRAGADPSSVAHDPLAVVAPCGALLVHGSPDDRLDTLDELDRTPHALGDMTERQRVIVESVITSCGQRPEVTARLLDKLSRRGPALTMVIHGHDRDEAGWFSEGDNQLCPVLAGAPRENRRYLRLDLSARYQGVAALRDGIEIVRLHP